MHLLGVFAHPDDEAYTLAGCLARYSDEGIGVTIVCFTRGEAGMITEGSGATRETLGEVREAELRAACAIVGCTDVRIVGTPDGGTIVTREGTDYIAKVIRELRPEVVATMEPLGVTSHPDHIAVSKMTVDAVASAGDIVRKLYLGAVSQTMYDRWMKASMESGTEGFDVDDPLAPKPAPDHTIACSFDGSATIKRKIRALWAHKTQSQEFVGNVPEDFAEEAMRFEEFQRAIPPFSAGDPIEDDLFAGLR